MNAKLLRPLAGLTIGLLLIGGAWRIVHRANVVPPIPPPPSAPVSPTPKVTREQVDRYYDSSITPLIAAAEERDREAVASAMKQIHGSFDGFRAGVPGFADDVTSWGTRGGVIQRLAQDQWKKWWGDQANAHRVQDYIGDKFKTHVLSEAKLNDAFSKALAQLRADLEASHNQLAAEIKASVTSPQCPVQIAVADWNPWFHSVENSAIKLSQVQAGDSVTQAVLNLVGSGVAGWAGEKVTVELIAAILARLATSSIVTTTAGGGAAGTGGAGGGAAGSLGGPAGTVIGVGVGLAVGCVVDWWMTEKFKNKLNTECTTFLDNAERQMVSGDNSKPGLEAQLLNALAKQDSVLSQKLLEELRAKVP